MPHLKTVDYLPEISEEFLELITTQAPTEDDDEEMLRLGWEVIGTVIDVRPPPVLFFFFFFFFRYLETNTKSTGRG